MKIRFLILGATMIAASLTSIASAEPAARPPMAEKRPHAVRAPFGAVRNDDYYWLRDDTRKDPAMLAYLKAENDYADARLAELRPLRDRLYAEMVARVKPDTASPPVLKNGYLYYSRFAPGADYPVAARRKGDMNAPEQILLDMPAMAKGHGYFSASGLVVSPDNKILAFAEDVIGRFQYVLKFKDLESGETLSDQVANVQPNVVWSNDNRTIFYIDKDSVTLRSQRVKAHVLGTLPSADRVIYEEKDESYYIYLERTGDGRFLCIRSAATLTTEIRCASADNPARFGVVIPREEGVSYFLDHQDGRWLALTNKDAPNFRITAARDADIGKGWSAWSDVVAASDTEMLESFKAFRDFLAIEARVDANKSIRLITNEGRRIDARADEPAFTMRLSGNEEADTPWVRYTYHSLVTPQQTYELNARTGERRLLKAEEVPGYDPSLYTIERVWAPARDGTKIPVTLAYKKGFRKDGSAAIYQYAYGTYGASLDFGFEPFIPSLLDRGMVYAYAHIRGGGELGRTWTDAGRVFQKKNTFTDYIDVTRYLVGAGYGATGRVMAVGESAGGALMGFVANAAPQDYRVIAASVPFVDAVTTMLDPTIPLVTNEYAEWGNPANRKDYDYILSWSPYDNVRAQAYPAMFVDTGLWDSQVQYYEPAKWVARLRATRTDDKPLLFRTNMEAGHGGKSGRFQAYAEQAEMLAFGLDQLGLGH